MMFPETIYVLTSLVSSAIMIISSIYVHKKHVDKACMHVIEKLKYYGYVSINKLETGIRRSLDINKISRIYQKTYGEKVYPSVDKQTLYTESYIKSYIKRI